MRLAGRNVDSLGLRLDGEAILLLNTPDSARHVLTTNAANYTKETPTHRSFRDNVADGIVTASGPDWASQRALLTPVFRDIQHLSSCAADCIDECSIMLSRHAESGEPVNLTGLIGRLTLAIATKAMFNLTPDPFLEACAQLGTLVSEADSSLPPESAALATTRRALLDAVNDAVAGHNHDAGPVLRVLLDDPAHADQEVLANQIATLLIAGFETTAHSLTWAWILLMQHPDVYQRLARSRDPDMARTVVDEALRLYPTAWIISRHTVHEDRVGAVDVRAGTTVVISPFLLHRHPRWWVQPGDFVPERFGSGQRLSHRYAYIPFGAGQRFCLGKTYALEEAQLILSRLGRRFAFTPIDPVDAVSPEFKFVLRPPDPLMVTVQERNRGRDMTNAF